MLKAIAISGIKWTSFSSSTTLILGLIQIGFLSRYLSKEEIGILSILTVVVNISSNLSNLGLANSIIHFQNLKKEILDTLYSLNLLASIITYFALLLSIGFIETFYNAIDLFNMTALLGLSLPITAIGQQFQSQFQRDLNFKLVSTIKFIQALVIFLVTIITLTIYNFGLYSIIYGIVIGAVVYSILFFFFGTKKYGLPIPFTFQINQSWKCIRFGLFQLGQGVLNAVSSNLDKFVIGKFFGLEILGVYELAYRLIIKPIQILNPIFNQVSFPIFSKIQDDHNRINKWYINKVGIIAFLSIPLFFGIFALSEEIILILYGPGWELTAKTLGILWILGAFKSIENPIGSYLLALGKPDYGLYLNAYTTIITVITLIIGGLYLNYFQLLLFYTVIFIIFTIPLSFYLRKKLSNMSVMALISKIFPIILTSALMFFFIYFFKSYVLSNLTSNYIYIAIASVIFGAVSYFGLTILFNKKLITLLKSLY